MTLREYYARFPAVFKKDKNKKKRSMSFVKRFFSSLRPKEIIPTAKVKELFAHHIESVDEDLAIRVQLVTHKNRQEVHVVIPPEYPSHNSPQDLDDNTLFQMERIPEVLQRDGEHEYFIAGVDIKQVGKNLHVIMTPEIYQSVCGGELPKVERIR